MDKLEKGRGQTASRGRPSRRWWSGAVLIACVLGLVIAPMFAIWLYPKSRVVVDAALGDRSLLQSISPNTFTGDRTTVTSSLQSIDYLVRIRDGDDGLVLDETPITCHGGMAHIVWHVGNLEPVVVNTGIHLAARLDGAVVGGLIRGSAVDTWGDDPAELHATVMCPPGDHVVDLVVRHLIGGWAIPYVVNEGDPPATDLLLSRGFVVTEIWNSEER